MRTLKLFLDEVLLIIGAVVSSFSEAVFWPSTAVVMVYFAKKYSRTSLKSEKQCIMEFSAFFYSMYEFNQVVYI